MAYSQVKLAQNLFTLVKSKDNFTPGQFADGLVKLLTNTYPQVSTNLLTLETEIGDAYAKVTANRDLIKNVTAAESAKAAPNPQAVKNLQTKALKKMESDIAAASKSHQACHKALEGAMTNLEAQLQQSAVNDRSRAEADKAVKFLATIEPRVMAQLERVKEMQQYLKQSEILVDALDKKASNAAVKTEAALGKSLDELKMLLEAVTKKSNHIIAQYIGPLEEAERNYANYLTEPEKLKAEPDKKKLSALKKSFIQKIDQQLKKVKRSIADGENSLDAFDQTIESLKMKIDVINKQIGGDRRLAAQRGEVNKYGPLCDTAAQNVYSKAKKYLDVKFLQTCMNNHKKMMDAVNKL